MGGFRLSRDGDRVELAPAGERVIAFLTVQRRPVTRLEMAGVTAGESTDERALGRLRTTLWRLTRNGAGPIVTCTRDTLSLQPGIDVDLYDQADSISCIERGLLPRPDRPDSMLVEQLLPGWYDDWVIIARERNQQRQLHALEQMVGLLMRRAEFARALDLALHVVERDPLRESAHRCVIGVHLAEGNLHAAVSQYRSYLRRLADAGLGPRPSPQLSAMVAPCLAMAG
jgi:DNA-binding SARP family transcriptional activator